jgi:hypothetical protein
MDFRIVFKRMGASNLQEWGEYLYLLEAMGVEE